MSAMGVFAPRRLLRRLSTTVAILAAFNFLAPLPADARVDVGAEMPRLSLQDWPGAPVEIDAGASPVLVVEFWATWCVPCRELLPAMARLLAEIDDPRLRVVAVNIEPKGPAIESFLDSVLPARTVPLYRDSGGRAMARLGAPGMPSIYLVVGGVVRAIEVGYDPARHAEFERSIRAALAELP